MTNGMYYLFFYVVVSAFLKLRAAFLVTLFF